jgi:ketosteroid isomerase-like protein
MDPTEKIAVVESYYRHVDAGNLDAVFDLFADDVVYHRPGQPPLEGLAAFERFYRDERSITDGTHAVQTALVDGDAVAVRGQFTGTMDGDHVELGFAEFYHFDDAGEITARWSFTDRDSV